MAGIIVHPEKISDKSGLKALCPFDAIEVQPDGLIQITAGCRLCKNPHARMKRTGDFCC